MSTAAKDIATIVGEAIEIASPAEREAFLSRVCNGDAALRKNIDQLLRDHAQAGRFLQEPALVATLVMPPDGEGPGMAIGPYKLLEKIGEGGFGIVFMAEQVQPVRRKVALKILKPGMDTRQVIARFEAERQALAIMDHPHIAKVFDGGATPSGRPYFVMELVKGVPITEFCDQNHLTPRQRLELFVPVCQAVQHAHQKGIIHRDLKPSNVMVTVHDTVPVVKVIDFGVAKALGQELTEKTLFTGFAQMIGTPIYMSPEQAGQSGLDVDTRSDIYSLGVLLYELLTGTTPFTRDRFKKAEYDEIRRIIREEEPPKPSTRLSESQAVLPSIAASRNLEPNKLCGLVRGELDWIVMKALEKDRNRRYETATGLALDIQRYLADEPVEACPPSATYRFRKFTRRNKAVLRTTAAVALILIAGTATSILLAIRATEAGKLADARWKAERSALQAANEARHAEAAARNEAVSIRDQALADAYRALLGETRALREARPSGWRATALKNLRQLGAMETPRRDLLELRTEAVACFGELDAFEINRFEGHTHLVYGLDFSPDGSTLATAGYDGRVCLWNAGQRRPARQLIDPAASLVGLWGDQAPLPVVRFRPDGEGLAYTTWSRQTEFLSLGKDRAVPPAMSSPSQPRDIVFDVQGKRMAISWGSGQVGIYDPRTGEIERTVDAHTPAAGFYMRVALSPSGELLATRGPGETVQVFRLGSHAPPVVFGSHGGLIRGLAFSSDGRLLASASEDRTAKVWSVVTGKELLTLQGHAGKVISIAFSPDDELLATGSDDGTLRLWEAQTGRPLMVLTQTAVSLGAAQGIQAVAFSPDGRRVAAASVVVTVFEIAPRRMRRLAGHGHMTSAVAFHPREPILASASKEHDVTFWDVEKGRELRRGNWLAGPAARLQFSPDGSLIAGVTSDRSAVFGSGLIVLEAANGNSRGRLTGLSCSAAAFDPSGRSLATGNRHGRLAIWDPASGDLQQNRRVADALISHLAFIQHGSRAVIGDIGGTVQLRDAERNHLIAQTALPGGLFRFAVDPRGSLLAAVGFFGELRVLGLPDLKVRALLQRYDAPGAMGLAFGHDGQWLATGGIDRRVTIWNTRTLSRSFTLPPVDGPIIDVAFQPDGSRLAVASVGELIPVWDFAGLQTDLAALGLSDQMPPGDSSTVEPPMPASRPLRRFGPMVLISGLWEAWVLEDVLAAQPDQPQACMELAWLRLTGPKALRDPEAALDLARRAVGMAPDSADCLNALGVAYYRLGRWDEAVETLQASARANPQGASGYDRFFLAMSYRKLGQADRAREEFNGATEWWSAAQLSAAQADELNAIRAEAELVLEGKDESPATSADQLAAGREYLGLGLWALAVRHFAKACEIAPENPQHWNECGRAHAPSERWREALSCFARARELDPDNVEFRYHEAIAYLGSGDLEGYRRACAAMLDWFRETSDPAVASVMLYTCLPAADVDTGELVRLARIAVPLFPGNMRVLGAAFYRAGKHESALEQFAELDKVGQPKAWDWLFRAMAHARLNQRGEAQQCLARAKAWIDQADRLDFGNSPDRWFGWFEPIEVRRLLRETESLLKGQTGERQARRNEEETVESNSEARP